jgi:hypothetical protein
MEYILYSALTWVVLMIAGLPVCLLALPASLRRHSLLFAPLLGLCFFVFVSYYLFRLNIGGTDAYAHALFAIPVVALAALCAWRKNARIELLAAFNRESLGVLGLMVFGLVVIAAPFFTVSSGRALAMAMSNLDIAELAVVSRFLQEFPPDAKEGFLGQTGHLVWTCRDVWFGPSAIVAIAGSLVHAAPFQLQTIVMSVVAVQAVGFVYLLARLALQFRPFGAAVIACLYAINPVVLFTIWQSFGGQMFAMALMLALFLVQISSFEVAPTDASQSWRYLLTSILLLSGILLSYHFMVLISGMLLGAYALVRLVFSRQWTAMAGPILLLGAAYALCALLNPLRVKALVASLGMLTGNNGWFIPWLSPDVIGGANAATLFVATGDLNDRLFWAVSAGLALLPATWHIVRQQRALAARSFALGLALPTVLIGFTFAYLDAQGGTWGGYRSFKITASFSSLTLLTASIAFAGSSLRQGQPMALLGTLLAGATAVISAQSSLTLAQFTRDHAFLPVPEIQAVQEIESMPGITGINIMDADNFSLLWTNYFTLKVRQTYQRFPYGGRPVGILAEGFTLAKQMSMARAAGYTQDIFAVETTDLSVVRPLGPWYSLYEAKTGSDVTVTPAEGWWPAEPTHRWSGSKGNISSVYIDSRSNNTPMILEATFMDLPDGKFVSAFLNGEKLSLLQDKSHLKTEIFHLKSGRNILEFQTSFMPAPPTSWDSRTLTMAWISIVLRAPSASP